MKKLLSMFLAWAMLAVCLPPAGAAAEDAPSNNSVDVVVLVDNSMSMNTTNTKSDPNAYRFDAAEMLVAMCDVNGSRVAYVPFAGTVMTGRNGYFRADTSFQEISDNTARKDYISRLEKDKDQLNRGNYLQADTNFGEALRYAVDLIIERGSSGGQNQPMIVLLTDGSNEINNNSGERNIYAWNESTRKFDITGKKRNYTKADADALVDEATKACVQLDIPIYTIILAESREKADRAAAEKLRDISNATDVEPLALYGNAEELPTYFGQIFADRIGSRIQRNLYARETGNGECVADIPILNHSIKELNILLPMKNVQGTSIQLYDGGGRLVDLDARRDVNVYYGSNTSPFRLYKITNPQSMGIWQLRFRLSQASSTRVSLSMVFNYNLDLIARIGKQENSLTNSETLALGKNDTLFVESLFLDNATGEPSADLDLYRRNDERSETEVQDWWEIKATCTVVRDGESAPVNTRFTNMEIPSDGRRFYAAIPLRLETGDYTMTIHVEGAGLSRDVVKRLHLTNTAPVVRNISEDWYVDYAEGANLPQDAAKGPQIEILLNQYAQDADADELHYTLGEVTGDGEILKNVQIASDGTDRYLKATVEGGSGNYAFGAYNQVIQVKDDSDTREMRAEIRVISGIQVAAEGSFPSYLRVEGEAEGQADLGAASSVDISKNTTVRQYVKYSRPTGDRNDTVRLEDFNLALTLKDSQGAIVSSPTLQEENGLYFFEYTTPANETVWTAEWSASYLNKEIGAFAYTLNVGNHPPVLADGQGSRVQMDVAFNELPSFLGFLNAIEGSTPQEDLRLNLGQVFQDPDQGDSLAFTTTAVSEDAIAIAVRSGVLTITPQAEGESVFTITAADNDGRTVSRTYSIRVKDLTRMWTLRGVIAAAALAAVIIAACAIHQARKPKFPPLQLGVREGISLSDSTTYDLAPSKKPIPISYALSGLGEKYGLPDITLQNLMLIPIRSRDAVQVSNRKPVGTVQISLNGSKLGKRPVRWSSGQSLELRPTPDGTDYLVVVLTNSADGMNGGAAVQADGFGMDGSFGSNLGVPDGFSMPDDQFSAGGFSGSDFGSQPDLGAGADFGAGLDFGASSSDSGSSDTDF